jgi:hypothetical protein
VLAQGDTRGGEPMSGWSDGTRPQRGPRRRQPGRQSNLEQAILDALAGGRLTYQTLHRAIHRRAGHKVGDVRAKRHLRNLIIRHVIDSRRELAGYTYGLAVDEADEPLIVVSASHDDT